MDGSLLYPNAPVINPNPVPDLQKERKAKRRERLTADKPSIEWCLEFIGRRLEEIDGLEDIEVNFSDPNSVVISLAVAKRVKSILEQMRGEMEKRMSEVSG